MKRIGLEKARKRLASAMNAAMRLGPENSWEVIESAWTRFLTDLNASYVILEQSAKGDQKSEGWFSRIKGQRKADDLLSYLMHARNANDHGIAEILNYVPGSIGIGSGRGGGAVIENLVIGADGRIESYSGYQLDGGPLDVMIRPSIVVLVAVRDRGVTYEPPKEFLGKVLENHSPGYIAKVSLEYVSSVFMEAESLVSNP